MQTFLPHASFTASAQVLDPARLKKQRTECIQILLALWAPERKHYDLLFRELGYKTCDPARTRPVPYTNHTCTNMWRGYESALKSYMLDCVIECGARGIANDRSLRFLQLTGGTDPWHVEPPWFGDDDFHSRHRAALLFKDPDWYSQWGWTEEPKVNYRWR